MGKNRHTAAITALSLVGLYSSAFADGHIDLKGFHLGMTAQEIEAVKAPYAGKGHYLNPPFTIGGRVFSLDEYQPFVHFTNGEANGIYLDFPPVAFDDIKAAVLTKFPETHCADREMTSPKGDHYTQTECVYKAGDEVLTLTRFHDLKTSAIEIDNSKRLQEKSDESAAKKRDL